MPLVDELRWDRIRPVHVKLLLGNLVLAQARLSDLAMIVIRNAVPCLGVDAEMRSGLDGVVIDVYWLLGEHNDLIAALAAHKLTCEQIGELYGVLDVPQMDTRLHGLCSRAAFIAAEAKESSAT